MSYYHSSAYQVKRRSYLHTLKWLILLLICVVFGVFGYFYRHHLTIVLKPVVLYTAELKQWLGSHKKKMTDKTISTAAIIEKEKPVHFEFYSTLPEVAMNVPKSVSVPTTATQHTNEVRVADNTKQRLSPFASSRDDLVKEFENKLDDSESASPMDAEDNK